MVYTNLLNYVGNFIKPNDNTLTTLLEVLIYSASEKM